MSSDQTEGSSPSSRQEAITNTVKVGLEILGHDHLQDNEKIALTKGIMARLEALADEDLQEPDLLRRSPAQCYQGYYAAAQRCHDQFPDPQSAQCQNCLLQASQAYTACLLGG